VSDKIRCFKESDKYRVGLILVWCLPFAIT